MTKLFKGAFTLGVSALLVKILGALYRVPLTNLIGSEGIGIYQMIFPFYTILLTLSSSGIPSALSKLVAEGNNPQKVLYKSIIAFSLIGLAGFLIMFFSADALSELQGNVGARLPYKALAPSVFLVSLIAPLRGYFQGKANMLPTAVSQIIEQAVKLCVGLYLIFKFSTSPKEGAFYAALSVTVSELAALLFVVGCLAFEKLRKNSWTEKLKLENFFEGAVDKEGNEISPLNVKMGDVKLSTIMGIALPITLSSIMLPLSRATDTFFAINLLSSTSQSATALFGLYSGGVETIVGVPVAVCYGLAVSAIPAIAKDKSDKKGDRIILYSFILSFVMGAGTFVLSRFAVSFLFRSLPIEQREIMVRLLRISSVSVVLLPVLQTTTSVLLAKDKPYFSCASLLCGLLAKIAVSFIALPSRKVGVYGMAFSDITCYFVATFFNLLYIITEEKQGEALTPKKGIKPLVLK